ncbi:sensor histidine kinase [Kribbella sp. NPDC051952]|uniref:sensor histidine kinase n=1 Tax=Kribbella sp. NPDC051952 TaxID=3154851 RepID=UPI00342D8307
MTDRLRSLLATSSSGAGITWPDVVLAVGALAVTQYWLVQRADYWAYAPLLIAGFVALTPLLIAVRRIDPALALTGLLAGAYGWSLLTGGIAWPLLVGCLLAVWSLPTRWGTATGLILTVVLAAVPVLADVNRETLVGRVYLHVYVRFEHPDGSITTILGLARVAWERVAAASWPRWVSVAVVVWCVAVMVLRRHRGLVAVRRTTGQRVEDLRAALLRRTDTLPVDVLIGVALTSPVLVELWADRVHGNWWTAPGWMPYAVAFAPLTLVVRRRWPAVPTVVLAIAALLSYWQTDELWTILLALAVALYSLGTARPPLYWSVPTAIVVLAALPAIAALIRYPQMVLLFPKLAQQPFIWDFGHRLRNLTYDEMVDRQWPISLSLSLLVPVCAGIAVRLYGRNREAARREAELEAEVVEREAEQVVLTERSHIARDLHDVVAHAVNLMVIQAETGPDLVRRGEADVLAGFQRIGDAGRRALGELDRLLSALRDADGVPDPQLAPQPGLEDLRQLVTDVSSDQLPISLNLSGDPTAPPAGHQLTAYRLVQEGLTNAVRHAKATGVRVTVESRDEGIAVEVADDGVGFDLATGTGGRHGLAGMRERVRVHHGTLSIDTAPGAGTTIRAWIPGVAE